MRMWKRSMIALAVASVVVGGDTDAYWEYTQSLIHFDGPISDAATIVDERLNAVRTYGTTPLVPVSTAAFGTGLRLGGTNYVEVDLPSTSGWTLDNADEYTVECRFSADATSSVQFLMSKQTGLQLYIAGGNLYCALSHTNNTSYFFHDVIGPVSAGVAYHLALCRQADNQYVAYLNGVRYNLIVAANKISTGGGPITLGRYGVGANYYLRGVIDELRVTVGYNRYPVACVVPSSPHAGPEAAYWTAEYLIPRTPLYMKLNGSTYNSGIAPASPVASGCEYLTGGPLNGKWLRVMPGGNSFVEIPDDPSLRPGTQDFSVDAFIKTPYTGDYTTPILSQYSQAGQGWILGVRGGKIWVWHTSTSWNGSADVSDNVQHHIAFGRSGNQFAVFVDGKLDILFNSSLSFGLVGEPLRIGRWGTNTALASVEMCVANLRMVVGTNPFSINFKAPVTGKYSADDQQAAAVRWHQSFDADYGSTVGGAVAVTGNAGNVSLVANGTWGSCARMLGSARFEGPASVLGGIGASDYCVEAMVMREVDATMNIISDRNGPGNTGFSISCNKNLAFGHWYASGGDVVNTHFKLVDSTYIPPVGKWVHVAAIRTGRFLLLFADGNLIAFNMLDSASQVMVNTGSPLYIGCHNYGGAPDWGGNSMRGKLDGVRITGHRRYAVAKVPTARYVVAQ